MIDLAGNILKTRINCSLRQVEASGPALAAGALAASEPREEISQQPSSSRESGGPAWGYLVSHQGGGQWDYLVQMQIPFT